MTIENLFVGSFSPASFHDTDGISTGTKMYFKQDGLVHGIRFYCPATVGLTDTFSGALYRINDNGSATMVAGEVVFAPIGPSGGSTWYTANFTDPVAVEAINPLAKRVYMARVWSSSGFYVNTGGFFSSDLDNGGNIVGIQTNDTPLGYSAPLFNGNYDYQLAPGFPGLDFNGGNYYVDVVYEAGAGPTPVTATLAGTLPLVTLALTGEGTVRASMAGVLPALAADLSGSVAAPAVDGYDLGTVDPIAITIAEIVAAPDLLARFGVEGSAHVTGLNEPPYPHVQITASPGGDDDRLLWTLTGEANVLLWGELDGRPGSAALRSMLYATMSHLARAADRDQPPGQPVIIDVRAVGSGRWQPDPASGQPCWAHTVRITAHPANG